MNVEHFLAHISHADLILTANSRLSMYLRKNFDALQVAKGNSAWISPQILPLSSWIEQTWDHSSQDSRKVLTDFQELLLWEKIIRESPATAHLLNIQATAQLVKDTWKLLNQWLLPLKEIEEYPTQDVATFIHWVKEFQENCHSSHSVTRSELLPNLICKLPTSAIEISSKIFFVGFDDLSPAIQKLQQILRNQTSVENIQFAQDVDGSVFRCSFLDKKQEIQEMARWAYDKLINNRTAIIGCILPNLSEKRAQINQIFQDVFFAESLLQYFHRPPVNISASENLCHYPILEIALKILMLNHYEINLTDISCLLRTPFIAGAQQEINDRAKLDARLRSFGEKIISLEYLLSKDLTNYCPLLSTSLKKLFSLIINKKDKKSLADWTHLFVNQLTAMGWPGERILNSTEFQLVERFKKLLSEYSSLDFLLGEVSFSTAYNIFQKLMSHTLFQPKSDDLPIQVLGMLEATGIAFDHLWVCGLDNETWPAAPAPNPFIPIFIQKKYDMPHATSDRELKFSVNLTKRFSQNSKDLVLSYAEFDGDRSLAPSPLITDYPCVTSATLQEFVSIEKKIYSTQMMESFIDDNGPPIENEVVLGGSWIFKSQAACPFQAFAKFRLHAESLDSVQMGLAFHERGSIVHEILANLWNQIKTHETLEQFSDIELNNLIQQTVITALTKLQKKKPSTLKEGLFNLEKQRLQKLIFNWLLIEKQRSPFEVIGCEQRQTAQIGKLAIQVQIDRIDRIHDNTHLIIDYKTGKPSISDWFSDRPNEPQLPLYTIVSNLALVGIVFAQVRADAMTFKGLTALKDVVPGAITLDKLKGQDFQNLTALINTWQDVLYQLADDFCQGNAKVEPKEPSTCQYCDLQELCRVRSRS